jgi:hypothetical protein
MEPFWQGSKAAQRQFPGRAGRTESGQEGSKGCTVVEKRREKGLFTVRNHAPLLPKPGARTGGLYR